MECCPNPFNSSQSTGTLFLRNHVLYSLRRSNHSQRICAWAETLAFAPFPLALFRPAPLHSDCFASVSITVFSVPVQTALHKLVMGPGEIKRFSRRKCREKLIKLKSAYKDHNGQSRTN
ncbi:hypothetical protein ILYODFUR_028818 [Ilyodon furcidens]|uniref:Uncharacterized protein n=1 Tax=Ilyodon furcidens TaxID=33524 RepID=A0ABV0VI40_9TELE